MTTHTPLPYCENQLFMNCPNTSTEFTISDINYTINKNNVYNKLRSLKNKGYIESDGKGRYWYTDKGILTRILYIYSIDDNSMLSEILN
jgi:predicted transcriptional regulator|tara:strand:+ start:670 stop:936 length:267 start_codon:yes stop_codon:yes gene_type:complete